VVSRPTGDGVVRLGLPEDFAAYRLTEMLSDFARSHPGLRLHVRCGKSAQLRRALERRDLDLALLKRDMEETGDIAAWPAVSRRLSPISAAPSIRGWRHDSYRDCPACGMAAGWIRKSADPPAIWAAFGRGAPVNHALRRSR